MVNKKNNKQNEKVRFVIVKLIFFLATCAFLLIYQIFRSEPNEKDFTNFKIVFIGEAFTATNVPEKNKWWTKINHKNKR